MSRAVGVGSYLYWSDRAVLAAAEDNGVDLAGRRLRWALTLAARSLQATL